MSEEFEDVSVPTNQEYDITTLKDIWEKIPADRMKVFFEELSTQMVTMKHMTQMINEVGMAMDETAEPVLKFQMPDVFTWKDDGKGECLTTMDFGGEKLQFLLQRTPESPEPQP